MTLMLKPYRHDEPNTDVDPLKTLAYFLSVITSDDEINGYAENFTSVESDQEFEEKEGWE